MNDLTETSKTPVWFKAVLLLGMLVFGFYASTHMVAAGDTWVAMACGRHFAEHGVDTVEPFSFNSHKAGPSDETLTEAGFPEWTHGIIRKIHPTGWVNQNWLTHLIFYKLATWFGEDGDYAWDTLVYWKFALYFITVLIVYAAGRVLGVPPLLAAAGACLAMVVGRTFYDIRPAGYSNMLVPAFILILALTMCKNYRWIWLLVPVVIFWANVHGGYIYAFIMLVPFIGINLLLQLPKRWTICVGLCGLWLLLYLMSYKFITGYISKIEYYCSQLQTVYVWSDAQTADFLKTQINKVFGYDPSSISLLSNNLFWVWFVLAGASVAITCFKNIKTGIFYFFHFFIGGVYFISLLPRFFTESSDNLPKYFAADATSSLMTFGLIYIAGAVMLILMAHKKEKFLYLNTRGIYHVTAAAIMSFVAMVVFNPFHLTNLTHTFEISVSKHAESWRQVNEWKPAFDFMDKTTNIPNPVGKEGWFGVLCVLTLVIFVIWLIGYFLKPQANDNLRKKGATPPTQDQINGYTWPKINLALIIISFLTIYMAIRSRRFIAIAGAGAAPIICLLIFQLWQMFTAKIRYAVSGRLSPQSIPDLALYIIRGFVIVAFLGFGIFWGMKYKRVYLDPWPTDPTYNSVFMRMTASHLKPMDVGKFIRMNKLSGRVFNYWTEGGAVALAQEPDSTGQIPLKLFMDGRAQAAYNHDKFKLWQTISSGGPVAQKVRAGGKALTKKDYQQIAAWIDSELKEREVWVILMPLSQEDEIFMKAMKTSPTWRTAYIDEVQHLLVCIDDARGKALIDKILKGQAEFPNQYSKDLTTFEVITENRITERYPELYRLAKEAFELNPNRLTAVDLMKLQGTDLVVQDFEAFLNDFVENEDTYRRKDGFLVRLSVADMISRFLASKVPEKRQEYEAYSPQFRQEAKAIEAGQIW